ncbi:hypothetical protein JZ751_014974 [Albula glossodonta]|uniref:Ig-like domain-containing protein n=1 Tax=Albula glossodonta TaxID=121402 RepID=A0A8T2N3G4_9TELE|nr:hypothetical protein JZ751_014974 [Albula glossodonta]
MATQNGLYSVESKLRKLPAKPSDGYTYFCTVNSSYDTESWRASLREKELSGEEGGALTVPCHAPTPLENFTLTWAFSRADEPEDIFTFDSRTGHTSNRWAGLARVDQNHALSGDGSLHLQNLRNKDHTGTYTCNFSAPRSRHLEHTCVNITVLAADRSLTAGSSWLWVIAILLAALALFIAALILFRKMKAERSAVSKPAEATEMQAVQTETKEKMESRQKAVI